MDPADPSRRRSKPRPGDPGRPEPAEGGRMVFGDGPDAAREPIDVPDYDIYIYKYIHRFVFNFICSLIFDYSRRKERGAEAR